MDNPLIANIGGWIGREIAKGNPNGWVAAATVVALFAVAYRLMIWSRAQ